MKAKSRMLCERCKTASYGKPGDPCLKCEAKLVPLPTCGLCGCPMWPDDKKCQLCGISREEALNWTKYEDLCWVQRTEWPLSSHPLE